MDTNRVLLAESFKVGFTGFPRGFAGGLMLVLLSPTAAAGCTSTGSAGGTIRSDAIRAGLGLPNKVSWMLFNGRPARGCRQSWPVEVFSNRRLAFPAAVEETWEAHSLGFSVLGALAQMTTGRPLFENAPQL